MRLETIIADSTTPSMVDLFIDYETYYDQQCSLRKLSTVEYITHPLFHVIGASIKVNDGDAHWVVGEPAVRTVLARLPWERVRQISHNSVFDAAITNIIFGHTSREYYCTMMASRPHIVPFSCSMSLYNVSKFIGTPTPKGNFSAAHASGRTLSSFTYTELQDYGDYANTDVDNCVAIYERTVATLSVAERQMIHLTVKKAVEPQLQVDVPMLETAYADEVLRKNLVLQQAGVSRDLIMSNQKFAAALEGAGCTAPMKTSPRTGKLTYAFAKTDLEFTDLRNHKNPVIQCLVEARLGAKSTIEETRLLRFKNVGTALVGWLPFPLMYYAAHTGRAGGYDKMNLQNLTRGSILRQAIVAPPGYKIVVSDLSQIEARMVAWLAGQDDLLEDFRDPKVDVYCKFGTRTFHREVTKETYADRFISKIGVLSLMYASGAAKFEHTVNASGQAEISAATAQVVVDGYRQGYPRIKRLWYTLEYILEGMIAGRESTYKCLKFVPFPELATQYQYPVSGVVLPDGRVMYYPQLSADASNDKHYKGNRGEWKKIYGGAFLENISQALAQIIIKEIELRMAALFKYKITAAGQVHDELVYCVPEAIAERFAAALDIEMCKPPAWAPTIPLACETEIGDSYADAK